VRLLLALRPTPATVIASIALLVALAGTGYAAITLPSNSVGTAQLKSNAVISSKVKDHSLLRVDFANGQIPRGARGAPGVPGPPGAAGAKGPTGPAGPAGQVATKWALVGRDGNFVAGSPGVVIALSGTGTYYVNFGTPLTGHALLVTSAFRNADASPRGGVVAAICGNTGTSSPADTITCALNNNTSTAYVNTFGTGNEFPENHAFYIAVL